MTGSSFSEVFEINVMPFAQPEVRVAVPLGASIGRLTSILHHGRSAEQAQDFILMRKNPESFFRCNRISSFRNFSVMVLDNVKRFGRLHVVARKPGVWINDTIDLSGE
jgi:hypothetical protein